MHVCTCLIDLFLMMSKVTSDLPITKHHTYMMRLFIESMRTNIIPIFYVFSLQNIYTDNSNKIQMTLLESQLLCFSSDTVVYTNNLSYFYSRIIGRTCVHNQISLICSYCTRKVSREYVNPLFSYRLFIFYETDMKIVDCVVSFTLLSCLVCHQLFFSFVGENSLPAKSYRLD